jgi:hypothetical protein
MNSLRLSVKYLPTFRTYDNECSTRYGVDGKWIALTPHCACRLVRGYANIAPFGAVTASVVVLRIAYKLLYKYLINQ